MSYATLWIGWTVTNGPRAWRTAWGLAAILRSHQSLSACRSSILSRTWLCVTFGLHCRQSRSPGCRSGLYGGRNASTTWPEWASNPLRTMPVLPTRWALALSTSSTASLPRAEDRWTHWSNVAQNWFAHRFSSVRHRMAPSDKSTAAETERFSLVPGALTLSCSPRTIQVRVSVGSNDMSASSWPYRSARPDERRSQIQPTASASAGLTTSWTTAGRAQGAFSGSSDGAGVWAPALTIASTPAFLGSSLLTPAPCAAPSRWDGDKHIPAGPIPGALCAHSQQRQSSPPDTWPGEALSRLAEADHRPVAPASSPPPAISATPDSPCPDARRPDSAAAGLGVRPHNTASGYGSQSPGNGSPPSQSLSVCPTGKPVGQSGYAPLPTGYCHNDNHVPAPPFPWR